MSDPAPSPSPAVPHGAGDAPTADDVITGALQESLDEDARTRGHIVLEWVLVANAIKPDGSGTTHMRFRDNDVSWPMSVGLIEYARLMLQQELALQVEEEEGDDE